MSVPRPKLYVVPGSHPCAAVEAALALKGIAFDRVDLLPLSQLAIGPLRYGGTTVPGMRLGSERLVGSRTIMRRLDELAQQPPLLPASDEPSRATVLDAERWGDEVFQSVPRRIIDAAFLRRPGAMESYAAGASLPLPTSLMRPAMPLTARLMAIRNKANDQSARADIAALPGRLSQIDAWIAEGVLGGEQPNAADLQIGSTIRLLRSIGDVRPIVDEHPAARLARYFPPLAGHIDPGALPDAWLPAITVA
ncbi:MAG TPA: glutathione S-transferase N-terminal domain-containing protein [Solirubrobacteraceae bacterium]|nr:glutathione S-transferase N-terminal domain-containing protein [Solirubrobacteraceae bacterium]